MKNYTKIIACALACVTLSATAQTPVYQTVKAEKFRPRDGIGNLFSKIKTNKEITIAYLGGSITAAPGWRPQTTAWFTNAYPNAKFKEVHAAIGGTGSDLGVFRLQSDVLQYNPDLLFVEFAVNDGGPAEQIWKNMEGIVRQTWRKDTTTDIMFVYTISSHMTNELKRGVCPLSAGAMEMLADFYGIPSVNFGLEVAELQEAGKLVFKSATQPAEGKIWFAKDDCHPTSEEGHPIYTAMLASAIPKMATCKPVDHKTLLAKQFINGQLENVSMLPLTEKMLTGSWKRLSEANALQKGNGHRLGSIYSSGTPGDKLTFTFKGSTAKMYDLVGPDGAKLKITVDGGKPQNVQRFDSYCVYYRIQSFTLCTGLDPEKKHTVEVEILPEQPDRKILLPRLKSADDLKLPAYNGTRVWFGKLMLVGTLCD
jgi:hypothetical protein